MNFLIPISLIRKELILILAKVRERRILLLYVSKQRMLAFFGQNATSLYVIKQERVIDEIEMGPKKYERVLPLYSSKQKWLAQMSRNPEKLYVYDNK